MHLSRTAGLLTTTLVASLVLGGCAQIKEATGLGGVNEEVRFPQTDVVGHCEKWPELRPLARDKVQVNILNNGAGAGAAATAAREFEARGFTVLTTGNESGKVPGKTPVIRYGEMGLTAARTAAQQVEGARLMRDDRRDPTVDVILGSTFEELARQPAAEPEDVVMNVYNTTFAVGLASRTKKQMEERGFTVRKTGNDPERSWYPDDTAVVRYGARSEPMARTVAAQVPGAKLDEDGRTDATVDLVLGAKYKKPTKEYTEPKAVAEVTQGPKIGC